MVSHFFLGEKGWKTFISWKKMKKSKNRVFHFFFQFLKTLQACFFLIVKSVWSKSIFLTDARIFYSTRNFCGPQSSRNVVGGHQQKNLPSINPFYPEWEFHFYWVLRVAPGSLDSGWLTDPKVCIEALGYEEAIQGHGSVSSLQTASSF